MSGTEQADVKVNNALDQMRIAAQDLHKALSDAAARHGEVLRADLEALPAQAKALEHTVRHSLDAQDVLTKDYIEKAAAYLHSTHTRIDEALKASGEAASGLIQSATFDARESLQKISEAIAAKRSSLSAKS